jgi:rhomboid protease GluP
MCPNCRAFITSNDRTCPYCDEKVGPRSIDVRQPGEILGGLIPHAYFTTVLILVINFGFFMATQWLAKTMGENYALLALGGKYGPSIWQDHEWWRLVTAGFLHAGWIHILMNSWVFYDLGAQTEQVYGTPRFLVIYFFGTVGGFLCSAYMYQGPSVGASAGIMGLIGAMLAFGVANKTSLGAQIRSFYFRWVIYVLAIGFFVMSGTDNWAHIGGLAAGFVIGYVAGTPVHASRGNEGLWKGLAALCIVLTAFSFFMVFTHFPTPDQLR